MDYDNPQNFERLTGQFLFTKKGEVGAIDMGNVRMHKMDLSAERKEIYRARRGKRTLAREDTLSVKPVYSLTGDEFAGPMIPLLLMGEQLADYNQGSVTNGTITFEEVEEGKTYSIGKFDVSGVAIEYGVGPTVAVAGTDYLLDAAKGLIRIPIGSVLDGEDLEVEYDAAAVVMDKFQAFTQLNVEGTGVLFEEDEFSKIPKNIIEFPCTISCDDRGEVKGEDFSTFVLKASVIGDMIVRKRQA